MKFKIHPLFFALALLLMLLGFGLNVAFCFVAVFIHELSHRLAAKSKGYVLNEMVIMPYGAVLYGKEYLPPKAGVFIAVMGPVASLATAALTASLWWIFPATYAYTEGFLMANLSLGVLNLLPAFPLDGGRVLLGLFKNQNKALKALRIVGIVLSVIMFSLFVTSVFFEINLMLGLFSVFMFYGATYGTQNERYLQIASVQGKNYNEGVDQRTVYISQNVQLLKLLKQIKSTSIVKFVVVDDEGNPVWELAEHEAQNLLLKNSLKATLQEVFKNNTH